MTTNIDAVELDDSPTVMSSRIAVGAALVAALFTAPFALLSAPFAVGGLGLVAGGLYYFESRSVVTVGVVSLFGAIVVAGGYGVPPEALVPAGIAAMLAWDIGSNALVVGAQIGRQAPTTRGEVVHAAATLIFGVLAGGLVYGAYLLGSNRQPAPALVLLIAGSVLLAWAIDQ
jgi:hypothetical protein